MQLVQTLEGFHVSYIIFFLFQIDWEGYFNAVFRGAEVFLNDDEKIIVREPEYFEALLPILADTPKAVLGKEFSIKQFPKF